jgi:hypothetical protein
MDNNPAHFPPKRTEPTEKWMNDADARLAGRLRRILETPGISDKDRKLVQRNLQRLLAASSAG